MMNPFVKYRSRLVKLLCSVLCTLFLSAIPFSLLAQLKHGDLIAVEGKKVFHVHVVEKGETVFAISRKYEMNQADLEKANPELAGGLKLGSKLLVPAKLPIDKDYLSFQQAVHGRKQFLVHQVQKSETLYAIAKKYDVPIHLFLEYNQHAESGVRENEFLRIPQDSKQHVAQSVVQAANAPVAKPSAVYQVKPGETLFSISRQFGATVDEIRALNPELGATLAVGTVLRVPAKDNGGASSSSSSPETRVPQALPAVAKTHGDGSQVVKYTIDKGDTFFALRWRYGVSKSDLIELNPTLVDGLKVGQEILLPVTKKTDRQNMEVHSDERERHVVQRGETLFGIAKARGFKVADIIDANPGLENRSVTIGETIYLPDVRALTNGDKQGMTQLPDSVAYATEMNDVPEVLQHLHHETGLFRVALMMPFYLSKNDDVLKNKPDVEVYPDSPSDNYDLALDSLGDTGKSTMKNKQVHPQSKASLNFYEGFLLGLDSLKRCGIDVEVKVYDTETKADNIRKFLNDPWLLGANLIVGPRDVKLQTPVAAFSAKNHIPMVAPLLANDSLIDSNPYYFRHTPSKNEIVKPTAYFVAQNYKGENIVVLTVGNNKNTPEWAMVNRLNELLNSNGHQAIGGTYSEIAFTGGGDKGHIQVRGAMRKDKENVILVPLSDNRREREATLARVVNALQVLSKNFNITLVGMADYRGMESIHTEYFHRVNLHYLTPSHVDYSDLHTNRFIGRYRNEFRGEPDQFSFRGYDIALFFGKLFQAHGANYVKRTEGFEIHQLQDQFSFKKKSALAGFQNQCLHVVNYNREWEIQIVGELIGNKYKKRPVLVVEPN